MHQSNFWYIKMYLLLFQLYYLLNSPYHLEPTQWNFWRAHHGFVLPGWRSGKEFACQCRRCKRHTFDPWIETIPGGIKRSSISCLENFMDKAWWATVYRVTKESDTTEFQNLEFSLWPQAVSSGSLAGFQGGGRLPPCPMEPFGFLIYVHHSEWSKPKALLIKDESEVTFEVVWYILHYSRKRRFIILEDKPFSWSYSGLTVSGGWNKRSIRSCDLCRKLWWNTSC